MAWRSSGTSNSELVENLWRNEMITHPEVKSAFLKVDRANYAPRSPYEDCPQPIGHHATISAPHMHASAVEHLLPFIMPGEERPAPRVLDIGSGSGYLTHVLAELVGERGRVVGVEHIEPLKELGERNMKKSREGRELIEGGKVRFRVGDGRKGWRDEEEEEGRKSWDAIHVGAAAVKVHEELLEQLASPGRMFIPVDDEDDPQGWGQHIWCVDKDEKGEVKKRKLFGVRYVPLTDAPKA
ncbi:Putative beta-aspartate methyltransferase [Podospora comata]|uniref:protein-L-isoaspartate(D-aspartate) O-methyltransferase n=1 Tax=Podospora comata TaxID=48703 RepID=A0ABY6SE76_PODCO|nr:Putative beta-aspartate methyltransferase [Podospora comata]